MSGSETQQALRHPPSFSAREERCDLLVFTGDWAHNRISLGNKEEQIALQLLERHLLTGGRFVLREFVEAYCLDRLVRFQDFEAQQFVQTPLTFSEGE